VFGLGYYLINYLYDDLEESEQLKKERKYTQISYERAKTIEEFNAILKKEAKTNINPFELLNLLQKLNLSPNITTYNNLLNYCFNQKKFELADKIEQEIFDFTSPIQPDITTINIVLKGISCKMEKDVLTEVRNKLIQKMETIINNLENKNNVKPNDVTLNTCLEIMIKAGEKKKAWEFFESMRSKYQISPDKYSISSIIKTLREKPDIKKLDKVFEAIELFKKSRNEDNNSYNNNFNDEIFFNSLIESCFKIGEISKAEELFEEMKNLGINISKITYSILIKGYGQNFYLKKALKLFDSMKKQGIFPNEVVYGNILNACVRSCNLEKAKVIFEEFKKSNLGDNLFIYSTMIKAFSKAKEFKSSFQLFQSILTNKKNKFKYNPL